MAGTTLVFSDLHLGWKWPWWIMPLLWLFGVPRSRSQARQVLKVLKYVAKTYGIERVLLNGDTLHTSKIRIGELSNDEICLLNFFWELQKNGKPVIVIVGNHDPNVEQLHEELGLWVEGVEYWWGANGFGVHAIHSHLFDPNLAQVFSTAVGDFFCSLSMIFNSLAIAQVGGFWQRHARAVHDSATDYAREQNPGANGIIFANSGCAIRTVPLTFLMIRNREVVLVGLSENKLKTVKRIFIKLDEVMFLIGHTHIAELKRV